MFWPLFHPQNLPEEIFIWTWCRGKGGGKNHLQGACDISGAKWHWFLGHKGTIQRCPVLKPEPKNWKPTSGDVPASYKIQNVSGRFHWAKSIHILFFLRVLNGRKGSFLLQTCYHGPCEVKSDPSWWTMDHGWRWNPKVIAGLSHRYMLGMFATKDDAFWDLKNEVCQPIQDLQGWCWPSFQPGYLNTFAGWNPTPLGR